MSISQSVPLPVPVVAAARPISWQRRLLLIVLAVVILFAFTYALAWYNSSRLGKEFFQDAEVSYSDGRYLDALVGYDEVNKQANTRIPRGGYYQTTRLWASNFALPKPDFYAVASERIQTIMQDKLDINSAEEFIQRYTGRNHPLFPDIYLRLGQLYEASGDNSSAIEIYRDCATLFPDRPDITQAAKENLSRLGVKN